MSFDQKKEKLVEIYHAFEKSVKVYKKEAVCQSGCAFCCTDVGNVDITTLEGLVIRGWLESLPKKMKSQTQKKLAQNRQQKEKQKISPCPFLRANKTCQNYHIRPFSCRQLYSLKKCGVQGPTIHRQAADVSKTFIKQMQSLDETGYSGHISFILDLLDQPDFRRLYLSGGFDPPQIMAYGKAHGLIINQLVL